MPNWRRGAYIVILAASAVCLSQCNFKIDDARMRLTATGNGSIIIRMSSPMTPSEKPDPGNSVTGKEMSRYSDRAAHCGMSPRLYRRNETFRLDVRADFSDTDDINSMLNCVSEEMDRLNVDFSVETGYFWNVYKTTFFIRSSARGCTPEGCVPFQTFPQRFVLSVPGKIEAVRNLSNVVGGRIALERVGAESVELRARPVSNYRAALNAHFRRHGRGGFDVMKVEVTSSDFRYDINTILAVLGLVFGSGLLIEIFRRVFRRKAARGAR